MRIKDLIANCGQTKKKKKTKPKFQLGRFLWKARVKTEKEDVNIIWKRRLLLPWQLGAKNKKATLNMMG